MIALVAAINHDNVIGIDNSLPWHIPEDLLHFKQLTTNHIIIMGRLTFESIKHALPNRINIVITKQETFTHPNTIVFHDIDAAIDYCRDQYKNLKIFIIGGGQLFEQTIHIADELFITTVDMEINTERAIYFPEIDLNAWYIADSHNLNAKIPSIVNHYIRNRCGILAIMGRPNVGKSTILNTMIGKKITITSDKPQTTQTQIQGILTIDNYQMIFIDTPGVQSKRNHQANKNINRNALRAMTQVDIILFVVEAGKFNQGDQVVLDKIITTNLPILLVVNKKDKYKHGINNFIGEMTQLHNFVSIMPVSAKHKLGISELIDAIKPYISLGDFVYSRDIITDQSLTNRIKETIREKLFRYLGEELPYVVSVEIDKIIKVDDTTKISATIYVTKVNQKSIIIGHQGSKLKKISTEARIDIEKYILGKIYIRIWVKLI